MNQIVKLRSHCLVPRTLFRIFTEPLTASTCSSFVVIFPGMLFKYSVRVFFIISCCSDYHWYNFSFLQFPSPLDLLFQILVFDHFPDFFSIIPLSLGTEISINNVDFSILCLSTMSTLDGIVLSCVSTKCSFSRIGFGLCFHDCSSTIMLKCLQM